MTKRKAKKLADEKLAKLRYKVSVFDAIERRRAEEWMMNPFRPVIPPSIARWIKP